jgi:hypothetical protein
MSENFNPSLCQGRIFYRPPNLWLGYLDNAELPQFLIVSSDSRYFVKLVAHVWCGLFGEQQILTLGRVHVHKDGVGRQ